MDMECFDMDMADFEITKDNFRDGHGTVWNYYWTWSIMQLPKVILEVDMAPFEITAHLGQILA